MRAFRPIDLALALRRAQLADENARLRRELATVRERVRFLESLLGMEPGEEIVPLRRRRTFVDRLRSVARA